MLAGRLNDRESTLTDQVVHALRRDAEYVRSRRHRDQPGRVFGDCFEPPREHVVAVSELACTVDLRIFILGHTLITTYVP